MRKIALPLLLFVLASPAHAWGDAGHQLVARIAAAELTPMARRAVAGILAKGGAVNTPECALTTLETAATWPDCVRRLGDRFAFASPWHYQDISICGPFDANANCADGNCVTGQIPRQLAIMADKRASPAARAQALAFVAHFVGDMHQPLHVGERDDQGGNKVAVSYGAKGGPRMNLHRVWDSELAERALSEPPAITAASPTPAQRRAWAKGSLASWARESWAASRDQVYPGIPGVAPGCPVPTTPQQGQITEAYVQANTPLVRAQVMKAGVRLAWLLNGTLGR
ncbi:MAG: S1/P1 nuclease [Sphingomonadales bacterium]|jgi:hypothetical protein